MKREQLENRRLVSQVSCSLCDALVLVVLAVTFSVCSARVAEAARRRTVRPYGVWPRPAAEKFIPSLIIKYGGDWPSLEEAAKFDFIDTGTYQCGVYKQHGNTWKALKSVNPDIVVVAYQLGLGEYNTATWGQMGKGWDWLKQNHGLAPADLPPHLAEQWEQKNRWVAKGKEYGKILQGIPYPNERLMDPGRSGWQEYWYTTTYDDFWGGGWGHDCSGLDGIFSDNTRYKLIWANNWHSVGEKDEKDHPDAYYENGQYVHSKWKDAVNVFLSRAVPWLKERGVILVLNFAHMSSDPEHWLELESQPHPPYAGMVEGAFLCHWGRGPGLNFRSEEGWKNIVDTTLSLKNVRVLMTCLGKVEAKGDQKQLLEAADKSGFRGWDAMWYCMASVKMCHDDTWTNVFLSFTLYGQTGGGFASAFFLPDEWDPQYLHLGRAVGGYFKVSAKGSHVYMREFEDGWAAVNATREDASGIQIPGGAGRVLNHDNFKKADELPYVATFDLPAHHGVFIVRPGKEAGNKDNPLNIPPQFAAASPIQHVGREGRRVEPKKAKRPEKRPAQEKADAAKDKKEEENRLRKLAARAEGEMKKWIVEGTAAGRSERVYVPLMGRVVRAKLLAADDTGVTVRRRRQTDTVAWGSLSPKQFYRIARLYAAERGQELSEERAEILRAFAVSNDIEAQ